MAAFDDWGEGTSGSEHNDPRLNHDQFRPVQPKTVTPEERSAQVGRVVDSVRSATPSERIAGTRFYSRAHRDAVRVGLGMNPGMQPYDSASRRPGRTPLRKATPEQQAAFKDPVRRQDAAQRGAGAIAALSPSSPAGMDWEHNPTAAYEAGRLPAEHIRSFREADEIMGVQAKAIGAQRTAKKSGEGVREANRAVDAAKSDYQVASAASRAHLEHTRGLRHAGGKAIIRAHEILSGEKTPEEVLPMGAKTGHFYRNINNPGDPGAATIDGRSHDIAIGKHMPWDTARGLGKSKARYEHFVGVYAEAGKELGMSPGATQATSWIQDKNAMMAKSSVGLRNLGRAAHGSRPDR